MPNRWMARPSNGLDNPAARLLWRLAMMVGSKNTPIRSIGKSIDYLSLAKRLVCQEAREANAV